MTWLRVAATSPSRAASSCQRWRSTVVSAIARRMNSAAPTRSSPDGVKPEPRPSNGTAAAYTASVSQALKHSLNARTRMATPENGKGGVSPISIAPKPLGVPMWNSSRASRAQASCSVARDATSNANAGGCHGTSLPTCNRAPSLNGVLASSTTARGCMSAGAAPIQTISPAAETYGASLNPAMGLVMPSLRTRAACALQPMARITDGMAGV